ncbi:hypothetical protein H072_6811 [Dactylellina haptotyla CBS 200.50]|uniref:Uncharacterized protein n=1 Tax=Dactylellina haptotyla (strain CBS 200.50) TaxID=1284197 RepID=S8A8T5_DACHA|nr:hypothetical protein H072_6811 [Dactylellina haptotyla CBS 200.50]
MLKLTILYAFSFLPLVFSQLDWGGVGVWYSLKSEPNFKGDGPYKSKLLHVQYPLSGSGGVCIYIPDSNGGRKVIDVKSIEVQNGRCYFWGPPGGDCNIGREPEAKFSFGPGYTLDASDSMAKLGTNDSRVSSLLCYS